MSEETGSTQTAIDVLRAENRRLNELVASLTTDRDKHKTDLAATAKERDEFKRVATTTEDATKQLAALQAELRTHKHRDVFKRLAKEAGAAEEGLDDLYGLSGYAAEKDEIDEDAIGELITDLKTKKTLFFPAPPGEGATPKPEATKQPAGQGRGAAHDVKKSGMQLTRELLSDPKFMLDPRNKDAIKDAVANGRVEKGVNA